ncbi:hypothetical protein H310_15066 [Aphanomyces invadans]|uniref:Uncharacterized protein n=1 Tax=Aphanomyces invadans TaxID=157072 RepID=A0A024T9T1_9STRA|nr:hypothetical protein H310_15066 [Aphanomyces invadans]ETV90102.1 hypothetical protein H310_15066 [Aphanomyces invadans]|eukprot:XP_008881266.1 hypothetical protein H310_15066 [Aphanomyces invadans]
MAEQSRLFEAHQHMLRQASYAMPQQHYKPFEEIAENDWRYYFLSAREVQELDLDAVSNAITSLKLERKIRDVESRVGRMLSDCYERLEQLDVAHLSEQESKQSVKMLTAAIRPPQLKAAVERS